MQYLPQLVTAEVYDKGRLDGSFFRAPAMEKLKDAGITITGTQALEQAIAEGVASVSAEGPRMKQVTGV